MNGDQLHDVLTRAAEPVPRPDLAREALVEARRVRRRRQGLAAGLACAAAVVVAVVGVRELSGPQPPVVRQPTPIPSEVPSTADPTPPSIDPSVVQQKWDPRGVADLPPVDVGLPASLRPPASAGSPDGWATAAALVEDEDALWLVDHAGRWARLALPDTKVDRWAYCSVLTTDGSRVVFTGRTGLWVYALGEGGWQRFDYPDDFTTVPDWGGAEMVPDAPDGVWIADRRRPLSWHVDLTSGTFSAFDERLEVAASGPGGPLVRIGVARGQRYLSIGALGDEQARWDSDYLEALSWPAADGGQLAAVRGVGGWSGDRNDTDEQNGLIALRLEDLSTRAYLPVPDPSYYYTDAGGLRALSWLDQDTVLAQVLPEDTGGVTGTRYLFTWHVATGELRLASSLPADLWLSVPASPDGG